MVRMAAGCPRVVGGCEAAGSLALEETCGALRPGLSADVVVWDLPHENALVQPWGTPRARLVLREGRRIAGIAW